MTSDALMANSNSFVVYSDIEIDTLFLYSVPENYEHVERMTWFCVNILVTQNTIITNKY